jgi:hypothetical protein
VRKSSCLLMAAAAALALAIPATASAGPQITRLPGITAKLGEQINLTGSDFTLTSSTLLGKETCEKLNHEGQVQRSNGVEFEIGTNGGFTSVNCTHAGSPMTITKFELGKFFSNLSGDVTWSFLVALDIGAAECTYQGTNVTGTYKVGSDTVSFNEATGIKGTPAPLCGTATLDAEVTLELGTTPVILD